MAQPRSWKASYRCVNNCVDEEVNPFGPEIDQPVNIKLYFGDHGFNAYFRLEATSSEYRCQVRTAPHIYERIKIAREHLHPFFVSEARAIIQALAEGQQYVPSRIQRAEAVPLTRIGASWTTAHPPEIRTQITATAGAPRPWPATANAFLYAVTRLNAATEHTVVDRFEKHPRSRPYWLPARQELPADPSTA